MKYLWLDFFLKNKHENKGRNITNRNQIWHDLSDGINFWRFFGLTKSPGLLKVFHFYRNFTIMRNFFYFRWKFSSFAENFLFLQKVFYFYRIFSIFGENFPVFQKVFHFCRIFLHYKNFQLFYGNCLR